MSNVSEMTAVRPDRRIPKSAIANPGTATVIVISDGAGIREVGDAHGPGDANRAGNGIERASGNQSGNRSQGLRQIRQSERGHRGWHQHFS
jgi:hypothetical protein